MPFTYTVFNLAKNFFEYYNILLNKLANLGVGVSEKRIQGNRARIKVQTPDEVGEIELRTEGNDIIVRFETGTAPSKKSLEAVRTGLEFISTILGGGSLLDASINVAEESIDSALSGAHGYLASTIANAVRDAGEELREKVERPGLLPPPSFPGAVTSEEYVSRLEEIRARIISLREEIDIARQEGKRVKGIELRFSRAEKLFDEAQRDAERGDYSMAKSKLDAANRILDRVEEMVNRLYYE